MTSFLSRYSRMRSLAGIAVLLFLGRFCLETKLADPLQNLLFLAGIAAGILALQYLLQRHEINGSPSIFPQLLTALFLTGAPGVYASTEAALASPLVLLAVSNIFDCYRNDRCRVAVFNAFFLLTAASLLLPPLIWTLPFFWMLFNLVQTLSPRRFLSSLAGIACVLWLVGACCG